MLLSEEPLPIVEQKRFIMHEKPLASIVVPLFNRVALTSDCWQSVVENTGDYSYEVIFVDNGSSDGTGEFLATLASQGDRVVTVVTNPENRGFASACNQGAAAAQSDIVVFLNNDTLVHKGWLLPLVEELEEQAETGVVGSKLLYPDGTVQHAGVCIARTHIPFHIFLGVDAHDPRVTQRRFFRIVTGACMAVRKKEFIDIGGFDEAYINGHEDVDLCLRYGEHGKASVYRPDSVVTHLESQSDGRMDHCRPNTERTLRRWHNKLMQDDFNYDFVESTRMTAARPLSIAIKIPATDKRVLPSKNTLRAEALARALCQMGHRVQIHANPDWGLDDTDMDVVLVIPGGTLYQTKPYSRNVLMPANGVMLQRFGEDVLSGYQLILAPFDVVDEVKFGAPILQLDMSEEGDPSAAMIEAALLKLVDDISPPSPATCSGSKVSVLMGTYNRRELLPEAIRSVVNQTHGEWELIVVNDGGEDVADLVYGFKDDRIRYHNNPHGSKGKAINTAFSLSSGEFVAYLDDDDVWYPDHLERALFALCNLGKVEMTYSTTVVTTLKDDGDDWLVDSSAPEQCPQVSYVDLVETNVIPGISVVHARSLFEAVNGMDETLQVLIDFDMWRRLAMHTSPYHVSYSTAEHFIRTSKAVSGEGQITNLHLSNRRMYLANACRVLGKKMPETLPEDVRVLQSDVRKKVQALFLNEQGLYYSEQGNHKRAVSCYKLAGKITLRVFRKYIAAAQAGCKANSVGGG